jgi:hypothetical protein
LEINVGHQGFLSGWKAFVEDQLFAHEATGNAFCNAFCN